MNNNPNSENFDINEFVEKSTDWSSSDCEYYAYTDEDFIPEDWENSSC